MFQIYASNMTCFSDIKNQNILFLKAFIKNFKQEGVKSDQGIFSSFYHNFCIFYDWIPPNGPTAHLKAKKCLEENFFPSISFDCSTSYGENLPL